ncbi:MAG: hypothetical protein COA98_08005, partial [Candidatus Neomarinimicrobiota bacterium]
TALKTAGVLPVGLDIDNLVELAKTQLEREADYLAECIRTGWISSEGPFIKRFEQAMAEAAGRRHGIAVTIGMDMANFVAMRSGIAVARQRLEETANGAERVTD